MWHTDLLTGAHTDECAGSSQALLSEEHKLSLLELSSHNLCAITYLRELEYIQFWHCIISRIRNLDIASWPLVFLPTLRRLRTMDITRPFKMLSVGDRWGPTICKLFLHVYLVQPCRKVTIFLFCKSSSRFREIDLPNTRGSARWTTAILQCRVLWWWEHLHYPVGLRRAAGSCWAVG